VEIFGVSGIRRRLALCCKVVFYDKSNSNKCGITMSNNKVISFEKSDVLTGILRSIGRDLITKAVHSVNRQSFCLSIRICQTLWSLTVTCLKEKYVVIGPINIKAPTTHDGGGQGIHFRSDLLPYYIKRIKNNDDWKTRSLSKEDYIYIWLDAIYFNIRSDDAK
jgi:hypothetical protein